MSEDTTLDENTRRLRSPAPNVPGFEIVGELGRGGMGVVYRARRLKEGDEVALKVIVPSADDPKFLERFSREIQAAVRIPSPHVVRVLEWGQAPVPHMATEMIDGGSLKALIAAKIPVSLALLWLDDLLAGLGAAHGEGVVHRDVKPHNLLIASDGRLKIADFGVARLTDQSSLTSTGGVVGTPAYMCPEQLEGKPIDAATDLFAAGIVFYEMVTGEHPFRADSPALTMKRILEMRFREASEVNPLLPDEIDDIIARMIAPREKRAASAAQARAQLAKSLTRLGASRRDAAEFLADERAARSKLDARLRGAEIAAARNAIAQGDRDSANMTTLRLARAWPGDVDVRNLIRDMKNKTQFADNKSAHALALLRKAEKEKDPAPTLREAIRIADREGDFMLARTARRALERVKSDTTDGKFVPAVWGSPNDDGLLLPYLRVLSRVPLSKWAKVALVQTAFFLTLVRCGVCAFALK